MQPNTVEKDVADDATPPAQGVAPTMTAPALKRRTPLLWLAVTFLVIGALILVIRNRAPTTTPGLPDPAPASEVVPVPAKPQKVTPTLAQEPAQPVPPAVVGAPDQAPTPGGQIAPAVGAPAEAERTPSLTAAVADEIRSGQREQLDRLDVLSRDIAELKTQLSELAKTQRRPSTANKVPPKAARAPAPKASDEDAAQLLSVDLWAGKPSIVVARGPGRDAEIAFLNEGEKQGRVTVKRADVGSQRAVIATDKGDVVLSKGE